jgi:hypothetical protein
MEILILVKNRENLFNINMLYFLNYNIKNIHFKF